MGFDPTISVALPVFENADDTSRFVESEPADLQLAPDIIDSSSFTVDSNGLFACTGLSVPAVTFVSDGADLEGLLTEAEYDRSRIGELTDANFADGSLTEQTFSGALSVPNGGTGLSSAPSNAADGSLVLGGDDQPLRAAPFAFDGSALELPPGGIQLGSNVLLGFSNGVPGISVFDMDVFVDLSDLHLEILPVVSQLSVALDGSNASAVSVSWETTHDDTQADTLYFKLVKLADYVPMTAFQTTQSVASSPEDLSVLTATESNMTVSLAQGTAVQNQSFEIVGLDEITEYRLIAVTTNKKGSISPDMVADFRTTEYDPPQIISVDSLLSFPTAISFAASNGPDVSEMLSVAGLLSSSNEVSADQFNDYVSAVRASSGGNYAFFETTIAANTPSNSLYVFNKAYNPATGQFEDVMERETYFPFVFFIDNESNATLCNISEIFNPDITDPIFNNFREEEASRTSSTILLQWDAIIDP